MKKSPFAAIAAILCAGICFVPVSKAADAGQAAATAAPTGGDIKTDLAGVVKTIKAKAAAGKKAEGDYADDLKQCDAILEEHKAEKTDDVATVLLIKAQLYSAILGNNDKAVALLKEMKADYPDTDLGMNGGRMANTILRGGAIDGPLADEAQPGPAVGSVFPDFEGKDLDGKPASVAGYKDKIVLVDFWATWCGPCVGEMPNVLKAYEKYHDKGFEVIGISLDRDQESLAKFIKDNNIPWPQIFEGASKLATKYGIQYIPMNFLVGKDGKIIDKGLRGDALDEAVGKAIAP